MTRALTILLLLSAPFSMENGRPQPPLGEPGSQFFPNPFLFTPIPESQRIPPEEPPERPEMLPARPDVSPVRPDFSPAQPDLRPPQPDLRPPSMDF